MNREQTPGHPTPHPRWMPRTALTRKGLIWLALVWPTLGWTTLGSGGWARAEPLWVANTYAAGTIVEAASLGYRFQVPPGYQAQLAPSEETPGVALQLRSLQGQTTIQVIVLPDAPATALDTAFPALLKVGSNEATLKAPPNQANVGIYTLPGGALLTRRAAMQTAPGGRSPTRVIVMAAHIPAQQEQALRLLDAVLGQIALVPVDPLPAQLWRERLKVAQKFVFLSTQSGGPEVSFGLCDGQHYALTLNGLLNGFKGKFVAVPLNETQLALKLSLFGGVALARINWDSETATRTEMSLQLNAPPLGMLCWS